MKPYLWTLGSIWGAWFACMLAASVASVVSTNAWALYAPYFVWFLGIAVSAFFTVVAFLAIAGARCLEAAQRRRD